MSLQVDKFRHLKFEGATPIGARAVARPPRQAPSPSVFSAPYQAHSPVISPADRLLLEEIFCRHNLNVGAYRATAVGRRVPACLRALQVRSPGEALRELDRDPAAMEKALNAILIGVTTFFRDVPVFAHLMNTALPDLVRTSPHPKVLSVGCSDGSELYSLAMCLLQQGVETCVLRGIDCRRGAIEAARAATYPVSALGQVPEHLLERCFDVRGGTARLKPFLRRQAQFQVADAFLHLPPPPYDLIACRNFAIYLEHAATARLWRRLHAALRPGGYLLVGKAERPTSGFLSAGPCLFRKALP